MNAFTWELAAQVIALHLTKHLPNPLCLTSDCTSAITVVNKSLRSHNNTLSNERGGILASAAHAFADPSHWRRKFVHTRAHPERNQRRQENPTIRDKAIFMADAIAVGRSDFNLDDKNSLPPTTTSNLITYLMKSYQRDSGTSGPLTS